jgi:large subunit ribosomal protein L21
MKYAVIKTGGKQYRVSEGDVIEVDRLATDGDKVVFEDVLLKVTDAGIKIGSPTVKGEKVEGKLVEQLKGDKIRVSKFKSKVRYRRVTGFRASLSKILIEKI